MPQSWWRSRTRETTASSSARSAEARAARDSGQKRPSHRLPLVVDPPPRAAGDERREGENDPEHEPGERGGLAHLPVGEPLPEEEVDEEVGGVVRPAVRHDV